MKPDGALSASALIEGIYEAALDYSGWKTVLGNVARFVGGTGAILYSHDLKLNQVTWAEFVGMDPDSIDAYQRYYSKIDARYAPGLKFPTGTVLTEGTIMDMRELRKTEFYQDFLRPYDIPHIAASILRTDPQFVAISVQGTRHRGSFGTEELERLKILVPHLARATLIGNSLGAYQNRIDTVWQLLDNLAAGVVALDKNGCILEANSIARSAFERKDALICRGRRLHTRFADADKALERIISAALCQLEDGHPGEPGIAPIPRMDGRRGYTVVAYRNPRSSPSSDAADIAAFLILIDHDAETPQLRCMLATRFGLSGAEAEVAEMLFTGMSLREVAETRRTSLETARKQLKSLFSKCDAKNQSRLMRIMTELASVQTMRGIPASVSPEWQKLLR